MCCTRKEPPYSVGDGVTQRREQISPAQVLQRLSIIAQIALESSTLRYLSCFISSKLSRRPSLHFSASGTSLTGSATLILMEE